MKNARKHEKKVRKLLASAPACEPPPEDVDPIGVLVEAVLQANAADKQAEAGLTVLHEEFVDYNELRVSPPKEIVDRLGKDYPEARRKAAELVTVLNAIFARTGSISLDYVEQMTKRDLRRHLAELGLSPYAASCLMLEAFCAHAVPVDETLVECLEMDHYIHPGSDLDDVQGFLERIVLQKDALAAHQLLRKHVEKSARALARKRKAEAEAAAKAEAERLAKAEAEKKRAAAAARKKAALARKKSRKKAARKAPKRTAKRTAKKTAKKTAKRKAGTRKEPQRAPAKTAGKRAKPRSARARKAAKKAKRRTTKKKPAARR